MSRTDFLAHDDCADTCQSDRDSSVHGAQPAMALGLKPVINEAAFMIKLVQERDMEKEEQQHEVHCHYPERRRHDHLQFRFSQSQQLRSARVPSSCASQSARTLFGLSS